MLPGGTVPELLYREYFEEHIGYSSNTAQKGGSTRAKVNEGSTCIEKTLMKRYIMRRPIVKGSSIPTPPAFEAITPLSLNKCCAKYAAPGSHAQCSTQCRPSCFYISFKPCFQLSNTARALISKDTHNTGAKAGALDAQKA
jgi:hypothetical protein